MYILIFLICLGCFLAYLTLGTISAGVILRISPTYEDIWRKILIGDKLSENQQKMLDELRLFGTIFWIFWLPTAFLRRLFIFVATLNNPHKKHKVDKMACYMATLFLCSIGSNFNIPWDRKNNMISRQEEEWQQFFKYGLQSYFQKFPKG